MSEELLRYYKLKSKKQNLFGYDDDGNLIELDKKGTVIKTIPIPEYRRPTYEEYDEMEKKRMESIIIANTEFDNAKKELREMISRPETSDSDIVRINRTVTNADIKLQSIRFPLSYVSNEGKLVISQIDFSQPNEKRIFPYDFYSLQERPYTLEQQYVRVGEMPKPLLSLREIKSKPVILFDEKENGYLSLK